MAALMVALKAVYLADHLGLSKVVLTEHPLAAVKAALWAALSGKRMAEKKVEQMATMKAGSMVVLWVERVAVM